MSIHTALVKTEGQKISFGRVPRRKKPILPPALAGSAPAAGFGLDARREQLLGQVQGPHPGGRSNRVGGGNLAAVAGVR